VFEGGTHQAQVSGAWGSSAGDVYAVGYDPNFEPVITHSTGNGVWTRQAAGTPGLRQGLRAVWGTSSSNVYAVGSSAIFHWTGNGTWSSESFPSEPLVGVWGSSASDVYAVGGTPGAVIVHSTGNGSWSLLTTNIDSAAVLEAVWGSGPNDVYVVGLTGASNPLVAHYAGPGFVFAAQTLPPPSPFPDALVGMWGTSASNVYALSGHGTIFHSTGDGTWTPQTTANQNLSYFAIWGSGPNDIYAGATGGEVLHSTGNGTWSFVTIGGGANDAIAGFWGSGPCDVYAVGSGITGDGIILHGP
jgi:hypothetical protein